MPVLNPAELWQRSGRYDAIGGELFRLKDRRGADMVLAMTHEEVVTTHVAQVVRSYRDLPLILYHFQTKERDEPRPRAGVLRTREFIMKDSYTFDRDAAGLDVGYDKHREAYDRIFERCGLEWYRVESDVGMMGGIGAHEYMAPCAAGENDVALAPGYAANVEVASATPQPVELPDALPAPVEESTPGMTTVAQVCEALGVPAGALIKAYPGDRRRGVAARARARRSPRQRHQARQRARRGVPARARDGVRGPDRSRRLHRPGRHGRADPDGRGAVRRQLHLRRQHGRRAPARRPARPRLRLHRGRRPQRRGRRHRRRAPDPDRARDRDRQHLQARHALFRAAGRELPGRVRRLAAGLDGLLRHRPRTHRGGRGGAVRRREGHLVAARAGAVRRAPRRARQAGHRGARAGRAAVRGVARARPRRHLRRPRPRARAGSSPTPSCSAARCG